MTDAEKIARMVEWMGGFPNQSMRVFNPFERIEDAFLLAHRIKASFDLSINWSRGEDFWLCDIDGYIHLSESPARAIAEAAWQVLSRLDPDRGSG